MRHLFLGTVCVVMWSCREIEPFQSIPQIVGYHLEGTVTTTNGFPLEGVDIRLSYNIDIVGFSPVDTKKVIVTDPTKLVSVSVVTPEMEFIRQLVLSYYPVGPVPRVPWDGRDAVGDPVPSGKYLIRYAIEDSVVKFSTAIVSGNFTARSNNRGRFAIPPERLPVGEIVDTYNVNNEYVRTVRVRSDVGLVLQKPPLQGAYQAVQLYKNQVTSLVFTIQ